MSEEGRIATDYRPLAVFTLVVLAYFTSEAVLRRVAHVPDDGSAQAVDFGEHIDQLPDFLRQPVTGYVERGELSKAVEAAETDADRIKALYALAEHHDGDGARRRVYRRILDEYPDAPEALRARLATFSDMPREEAVGMFLDYISRSKLGGKQRVHAFRQGWQHVSEFSREEQTTFLAAMADARVVHAELISAYERMRGYASRVGDRERLQQAKDLLATCTKLRERQLEALRKKQQQP
jgi:hypothetical protein